MLWAGRAAGNVFAVLWFIVMGLAAAGLACGGGGAADSAAATGGSIAQSGVDG